MSTWSWHYRKADKILPTIFLSLAKIIVDFEWIWSFTYLNYLINIVSVSNLYTNFPYDLQTLLCMWPRPKPNGQLNFELVSRRLCYHSITLIVLVTNRIIQSRSVFMLQSCCSNIKLMLRSLKSELQVMFCVIFA